MRPACSCSCFSGGIWRVVYCKPVYILMFLVMILWRLVNSYSSPESSLTRSRFLWNNGNEENTWKHCPDSDNQIYGRGNLLRQLLCKFGLWCFKKVYEANTDHSTDYICCSLYFLLCTSFVSWPQNVTSCFPCGWHPLFVVVVVTSRSCKLADSARR
jgi:hypothetical protein